MIHFQQWSLGQVFESSFISSNLFSWSTYQIDYVLAFPQAPIKFDMYMEISKGIEVYIKNQGENKQYVLKNCSKTYMVKNKLNDNFTCTLERNWINLDLRSQRLMNIYSTQKESYLSFTLMMESYSWRTHHNLNNFFEHIQISLKLRRKMMWNSFLLWNF